MLFEWLWKNVSRRLQLGGDTTGKVRAWKLLVTSVHALASPNWRGTSREGGDVPRQETAETRGKAACQKIRMGEVSRARQHLTGATLAPGNDQTLQELQRRRDQEVVRPLSQEVLEFDPERPVILDRPTFLTSLKSVPRFFVWPWRVHVRAFENSSG